MVTDRRLGYSDRLDQVAGGAGFTHAGDDAEQTQSGRITQDPEPLGQLSGLMLVERLLREGSAAFHDVWHLLMIPYIDGHRYGGPPADRGDVANCPTGKEVEMTEKLTAYSHGSG